MRLTNKGQHLLLISLGLIFLISAPLPTEGVKNEGGGGSHFGPSEIRHKHSHRAGSAYKFVCSDKSSPPLAVESVSYERLLKMGGGDSWAS